jgi:hypothetical protein
MKKFFITLLIFGVILLGNVCGAFLYMLKGFSWYHIIFMIGYWLLLIPAISWWKKFFYNLFEVEV